MPWFKVWDGLKNKTCRYLLHRYLGQFLEEKLNLEQLNVELYNGKASVRNVSLNVDALNELFEAQGWCVEVTRGTIGLISVTVPWNALMTNNSTIEIFDLFICLRPIQRQNNGASMLESMWSSVSSSLQLAQECMNHTDDDYNADQLEQKESIDGLEKFAETIDNVLNRIKAKCTNVVFKLEYMPKECLHGIAVLIKINSLYYQNNADCQLNMENEPDFRDEALKHEKQNFSNSRENSFSTYATHNIFLNDICIYTEEFKVSNSNIDSSMSTLWEFGKSENLDEKTGNIDLKKSTNKMEIKNTSTPIPILIVKGQQRVFLKMKQSEAIEGPKVIFDIELGDISMIVSPRQIHLLSHFYELFYDNKNIAENSKNEEISTGLERRTEFSGPPEYSDNITGGLEAQNVWGEINFNKIIKSTENLKNHRENPCLISINTSMSSSSTATSSVKFKRTIPNVDICSNISKFNVKIAKTMVSILQEDILVEQNINMYSNPISGESERNMLNIAEDFFYTCFEKSYDKNLDNSKYLSANNHVSLHISPITVDGVQQRNKNVLLLDMCITASTVELLEILDNIASPLIYFAKDLCCSKELNARPDVIVNLKSTAPFNINNAYKCIIPSKTKLEILLQECVMELDVSIYDRLSGIVGYSSFKKNYQLPSKKVRSAYQTELVQSYTNIDVNSGKIDIKLRFPIVDVRPLHDPDRNPWWKQNIRDDYILLCMEEICLSFSLNSVEIRATAIDAFYCENPMTKIHLLKVTSSLMDPNLQYPKIVIESPHLDDLQQCENCYVQTSKMDCCCVPFSTKRICRQSGTIHSNNDVPEEPEIFILPGETLEMRKFCDGTFKSSKLRVKMDLPCVILELESKQLYEIIYNRLNCDLFMWEPCAPILQNIQETSIEQNSTACLFDSSTELDTGTLYSFTNSEGVKNVEYFDFNELSTLKHNNPSDNLEYNKCRTTQEGIRQDSIKRNKVASKLHKPSLCSFEIKIEKGLLTFIVPTKNIDDKILPIETGKFITKVNNFYCFFVSGHKSNRNLEYLCLDLHNFEMFHCGVIPVDFSTTLNMSSEIPPYMKSTFYKTPSCLTKGKGEGCVDREMVSVVVEIKKIPEQRIKRLKITTGLQKTTLRHNPAVPSQTWLCQLLDFLEIKDYPVCGYIPYGIISEIQLHMWDCAIDYRPKNFPFRSVIEIGSFDVSSNVISSEMGCTLRFVTEECILAIARNDTNIFYPDFEITTIPSLDLVPVLEIGLLDISLRISDKATERCPKLDLRAVIQDVHLRTCSDSGSALAQLISYIANEGDSFDSKGGSSIIHSSFHSENEIDDQQEHVNKLMAEAVQEPFTSLAQSCTISEENTTDNSIEVFYFPDEGNLSSSNLLQLKKEKNRISSSRNSYTHYEFNDILSSDENIISKSVVTDATLKILPQIKEDLGDISLLNENSDESCLNKYEEYCFIAEEENHFMTNFGITNLRVSEDPLRIVDNHFIVPISKPDILKSPENFPIVEQRYTLCEMVFTWHLYGGNDFPLSDGVADQPANKATCFPSKGNKSNMSEAYKHGISHSNNNDCFLFAKKPKEKQTWKTIGGVNRHQEVLVEIHLSKVRCSHEVYSDFSTHVSRQVLIVNELEIRDRLQSSEINKFLYHQKLNKLPTTNIQNMIVLKALHVRPSPGNNSSQECSLKISLLPLRLHIDQDTLLFLVDFFTNLNDYCKNEALQLEVETKSSSSLTFLTNQDPIMKVDTTTKIEEDLNAHQLVSENLDILMKDKKKKLATPAGNKWDGNSQIYFREVIFSPEVRIRFDYHGRRVELSRGPVTGLLMGLGQLNCSEIRLKKIIYKRGLLGFDKLLSYLCKEWLRDIKKNQLPNILSGVGPTYAFIQLFQGIYDLFKLPIEQFQKDRRIIKGLQLGARSFTARTALAALEITSRIIQLLQFTAETAFDMVSTGPSVKRQGVSSCKKKRHHRPKDIREGVTNAFNIMKEGFNDSAHKFIENAVTEHDQKGYTGAVGAVMRQIPQLVVCPAVLATQATTNILGGAKSSLVPEAKWEARDKWKDDSEEH